MLGSARQDERESYLFADVASAADAGLTAEQILSGPSTASYPGHVRNSATLTEGLQDKGVRLAPHEVLMLETAEVAGNFSKAMHNLSEQRARRAARFRKLVKMLAYPVFLLFSATGIGVFISVVVPTITLWTVILPLLIIGGIAAILVILVRQTMRNPESGLIPPLRELVLDLGELPYLRSIHGLYSAGVKLQEAHALALETSPIPGVRQRLEESGRALAKGGTLSEALHLCQVLNPETRQMLTSAEISGDLEHALERAIERRQNTLDQRSHWLTVAGVALVGLVVLGFVVYIVFSFYLGYYESLGIFR